jgi:hypothetical protein
MVLMMRSDQSSNKKGGTRLVNQIVTVKHVDTVPRRIACDYKNPFIWAEPYNVLESNLFIRLHPARTTGPRDDLKIDQVNVNRMAPAPALVYQLPYFN